jgi:hypothetical protein
MVKSNARLLDEALKVLGVQSRTAAVHTRSSFFAFLASFAVKALADR